MTTDLLRDADMTLRVDDLSVLFGGLWALKDVTLSFEPRMWNGLIGPNGAGKTTLLNAISGFLTPTEGRVRLGDKDMTGQPTQVWVRRGVLRCFQLPRLLEGETTFVNIMLGRHRFLSSSLAAQVLRLPRYAATDKRDRQVCMEIAELLQLSDVVGEPVSILPFGTRRLVEIARLLAAEPQVAFFDEPAGGLDAGSRHELGTVLAEVQAASKITAVLVEHDVELVRRLCPVCHVLDAGRLIAQGATDEVLDLPQVREAYFGADHA